MFDYQRVTIENRTRQKPTGEMSVNDKEETKRISSALPGESSRKGDETGGKLEKRRFA